MHMKSSNKLSVFVTLFIMLLLCSCDFVSSYDFRIHNQTEDSISIEMTIKCPPYSYFEKNGQRFNCYENYYRPEIDTLVILLSGDVFIAKSKLINQSLSGFEKDGVTPFWYYIKSITIGEKSLDPKVWNHESAWQKKHDGHGIFFGETWKYDLWIDESMK